MLAAKTPKSQETREAILAACLDLFSRRGFAATSVDDIARAARITKGAVYWHFESKEALFQAILETIREKWQDVVLSPVKAESSARARLSRLFDGYTRLFTESPEICLFLQRILLENDDTFAPQAARIFRQTARFVAKIIEAGEYRAGVKPLLAAHGILGGLSGATQQSLANRSIPLADLILELKEATASRIWR